MGNVFAAAVSLVWGAFLFFVTVSNVLVLTVLAFDVNRACVRAYLYTTDSGVRDTIDRRFNGDLCLMHVTLNGLTCRFVVPKMVARFEALKETEPKRLQLSAPEACSVVPRKDSVWTSTA